MKILKVGSRIAIVDNEDYQRVASLGGWKVHKSSNTYYILRKNRLKENVQLHQFVMNFPFKKNGMYVHHKNKKGWDCRKRNLEIISPSEHTRLHHLGIKKSA